VSIYQEAPMFKESRVRARSLCAPSLFLSLLVLPAVALAHPESQAAGVWSGFLHPLTGVDHVLAMIAVGLWAAQLGRSAVWVLPAAFPFAMVIGVWLAQVGVPLPVIEPMIGLSVLSIGIAVATGLRVPLTMSALLIGFFAIFHGYAHSLEVQGQSLGAVLSYGSGFIGATVLLHLTGVAGGTLLARTTHGAVLQFGGSVIAAAGAALLIF
jgi:urease accessory protein